VLLLAPAVQPLQLLLGAATMSRKREWREKGMSETEEMWESKRGKIILRSFQM